MWENLAFGEGGEIFPWRLPLGALAVQCVREAVFVVRFARVAKIFPFRNFPARNYAPPPPLYGYLYPPSVLCFLAVGASHPPPGWTNNVTRKHQWAHLLSLHGPLPPSFLLNEPSPSRSPASPAGNRVLGVSYSKSFLDRLYARLVTMCEFLNEQQFLILDQRGITLDYFLNNFKNFNVPNTDLASLQYPMPSSNRPFGEQEAEILEKLLITQLYYVVQVWGGEGWLKIESIWCKA